MKTICIRVTDAEQTRIRRAADEAGLTVSDYLREALRQKEEKADIGHVAKRVSSIEHDAKFLKVYLEEMTKRMFKDSAKGEEVLRETLRATLERVKREAK